MTEPVRPVDPVASASDRPQAAPARTTLPVPIEPSTPRGGAAGAPPPRPRRTAADYAAQVLGQDGRRRGLKGGPETLEAARSAYLSTEYSGANDRRPKAGLVKRTEV